MRPGVKRFGRTAMLRPGAGAEYDRLHAAVWPEVLAAIARAGIQNYSIFRNGRQLFSYFEIQGDVALAEATRIMLADPACCRWEDLMRGLQEPVEDSQNSGCWVAMKEVFYQP